MEKYYETLLGDEMLCFSVVQVLRTRNSGPTSAGDFYTVLKLLPPGF